jgi:hypothetical protein
MKTDGKLKQNDKLKPGRAGKNDGTAKFWPVG